MSKSSFTMKGELNGKILPCAFCFCLVYLSFVLIIMKLVKTNVKNWGSDKQP